MASLAKVGDVEASRLVSGLDDAFALVAGRFRRREVRVRARACLAGMLSGLERKTGWSLAEHAGEATPDGMQRLFTTARWDADLVRDDLRGYVTVALGDPDGVLIGDDTGFEKKGACSAGVQRQYTGTAGKITNCQLGVFLAYAGPKGRALIDRERYLPRSWTADQERLTAAKVPQETGFRTKPQLLQVMIERSIEAGVPFGWVTADEAYGDNGPLRAFLEEQQLGYVMAVSRDHVITTAAGRRRADALAAGLPAGAWRRISCGNGAKGRRWYGWALIAAADPAISLLIRRSTARARELAFYLCHTPRPVPLARLVQVAGTRWAVEECFQAGKNEAGLDHYQVRLYPAWYRYVTLAMLALAWLAVTRASLAADEGTSTAAEPQLSASANEIRRMFTALCGPPPDKQHARRWSRWRQRHQERSRHCHYQRQHQQDHLPSRPGSPRRRHAPHAAGTCPRPARTRHQARTQAGTPQHRGALASHAHGRKDGGMRFVAVDGRASLVRGDAVFDVAECTDGAIPADPMSVLRDHWGDLAALALAGEGRPLGEVTLGAPVPRPPLILSVIANYPPASKSAFPMIVGKAPSAITGPYGEIVLPDPPRLPLGRAYVIAEPELAVVTGAAGRHLTLDAARGAIAGYAVAQDITERVHEFGPSRSPWTWENLPAKTLGKSIDTFCPLGPALVTPDELTAAGALEKRCWINGELTHHHQHNDMLWSPAELVALVSCFATLQAGTVLLCGAGNRLDRRPPPGLADGDVIRTEIAGVGIIENRCRNESGFMHT